MNCYNCFSSQRTRLDQQIGRRVLEHQLQRRQEQSELIQASLQELDPIADESLLAKKCRLYGKTRQCSANVGPLLGPYVDVDNCIFPDSQHLLLYGLLLEVIKQLWKKMKADVLSEVQMRVMAFPWPRHTRKVAFAIGKTWGRGISFTMYKQTALMFMSVLDGLLTTAQHEWFCRVWLWISRVMAKGGVSDTDLNGVQEEGVEILELCKTELGGKWCKPLPKAVWECEAAEDVAEEDDEKKDEEDDEEDEDDAAVAANLDFKGEGVAKVWRPTLDRGPMVTLYTNSSSSCSPTSTMVTLPQPVRSSVTTSFTSRLGRRTTWRNTW